MQTPFGTSRNGTVPIMQVIEAEWRMPKLCPGSWMSTPQPAEALYQVSREGAAAVPPEARPVQPQAMTREPMYQR